MLCGYSESDLTQQNASSRFISLQLSTAEQNQADVIIIFLATPSTSPASIIKSLLCCLHVTTQAPRQHPVGGRITSSSILPIHHSAHPLLLYIALCIGFHSKWMYKKKMFVLKCLVLIQNFTAKTNRCNILHAIFSSVTAEKSINGVIFKYK